MSIGTIFSIFIIVVIVAVTIYVIVHFLGINKCSEVGFFYEDIQDEVDKAWTSGRYSDVYDISLSSSGVLKTDVEEVCFGNLTATTSSEYRDRQSEFRYGAGYNRNANLFMYPGKSVCQGLASKKIEHAKIEEFFCLDVKNPQNLKIKINIETRESLVRISRA